ncbi:hypothetical protein FGO68_gene1320 [Halteria grandinella]|uniref:Uncharacterized protein n=1 Tax=Halteria grandinella TaxID=5974 RepID=A0A8J8NJF3_HALGN|nr:hypothetical protein FGO68_gene1320 [Halteria grandinella]
MDSQLTEVTVRAFVCDDLYQTTLLSLPNSPDIAKAEISKIITQLESVVPYLTLKRHELQFKSKKVHFYGKYEKFSFLQDHQDEELTSADLYFHSPSISAKKREERSQAYEEQACKCTGDSHTCKEPIDQESAGPQEVSQDQQLDAILKDLVAMQQFLCSSQDTQYTLAQLKISLGSLYHYVDQVSSLYNSQPYW